MTEQAFDTHMQDALLTMAAKTALQQECALAEAAAQPQAFSLEFEKRMAQLIKRQSRPLRRKRAMGALGRAAVVLLTVCAVAFGSIMSVEALRLQVLNMAIQWGEKAASFRYSRQGEFAAPQVDQLAKGIPYAPAYVPEGFAVKQVQRAEGVVMDTIIYENSEGVKLYFCIAQMGDAFSMSVDNEHSTYQHIKINGYDAHLFTATSPDERSYLLWDDGTYHFNLTSSIQVAELIRMAESVSKK